MLINLDKIKRAHFIGIGGIGISAIAKMMLLQGKQVSGSDLNDSDIIKELKKQGAVIYKGHSAKNVHHRVVHNKIDLVAHTTAIDENNPELQKAQKLKIPILTYPEILGLISRDKYTIAVAGTHGKTTTTGMLAKIMNDAKFDATVIIGSILKDKKSNLVVGKGKYLLCEACEYKRAFLNLTPKILVITNIDADHLDYYKDLKDIQSAFKELVDKLGKNDYLVCNSKLFKNARCKIIDYSAINADNLKLKISVKYNVKNAQAALAVAKILKINMVEAKKSLENFKGTWRRFEYKGKINLVGRGEKGARVYDDYAHHPTEIKAVLRGAREKFKNKKIWAVFQPHLYSRTKLLMNDFAKSFNEADEVVIADIYAAREKNDKTIHSKDLAKKIKNAKYIKSFSAIENFLRKNTKKNDIVLMLGAGNIATISKNLVQCENIKHIKI